MKYLNVEYVDRVKIIDPKLEKLLSSHSIENDKQHEVAVHNEYDLLYCGYIQRGFGSDRRFYVAYTGSELKGYGVFAAVEILPGQVIGEYTGVLTDDVSNTDYQWTYYYSPKKDPADKIEVKLSIDGQIKGNMLRYVNDGIKHNTQVTYVPCSHDNMWHIVYIAIEFIAVGEELSVSYGGAYCKYTESDKRTIQIITHFAFI